jgi:thiamine-phosphate pyrophosphorylase
MSQASVSRTIDANLNRLAEGLRVLEEVARMTLNDIDLTQRLKTLRHDLVRNDLLFNLELLSSRNSLEDVGTHLEVAGENRQKELPLVVIANSRRAQESLRVLEEMAKLPEMASRLDSDQYKQARFALYTLEQQMVSRLLRKDKIQKLSGLYVIIDTQVLQGRSHIAITEQVIQAGVKVIQLRDKTSPKKDLLPIAREMQALCQQNQVLFLINDYLDLALACHADGLHLGQDDLPVETARRLLPVDKIVGCSAETVAKAQAAEAAGADYIAVGSIFSTSSKSAVDLVGVARIRQIKPVIKTPLVAIGGINPDNVREVVEAGADSVCIISAVLNAPDITRAARAIIKIIEAKK